jgi:hypothetical protein
MFGIVAFFVLLFLAVYSLKVTANVLLGKATAGQIGASISAACTSIVRTVAVLSGYVIIGVVAYSIYASTLGQPDSGESQQNTSAAESSAATAPDLNVLTVKDMATALVYEELCTVLRLGSGIHDVPPWRAIAQAEPAIAKRYAMEAAEFGETLKRDLKGLSSAEVCLMANKTFGPNGTVARNVLVLK